LRLLRDAGIDPITIAPGVDEDLVAAEARAAGLINSTSDMVLLLAQAKARAVLANLLAQDALILGCDSALDLDGEPLGKPHEPAVAVARWQQMRGRTGHLHTGHWLIDNRSGEPGAETGDAQTGLATSTAVTFANLTDPQIEAYVATGEPLKVAGAFTIDGLGGAFLDRIEGDAHTVIGLSLVALRQLSSVLGVEYTSLWR
jgi:septum formation protein